MSSAIDHASGLRSRGFRVTSQRLAILDVLGRAGGHLTPTVVFARARRLVPRLTAPTVYRTLEALSRTDLVWRSGGPTGHLSYELAEADHDHLECRRCGAQVTLPQSVIRKAFKTLEAASAYAIDHHVTLSGLCPKCRRARTVMNRFP